MDGVQLGTTSEHFIHKMRKFQSANKGQEVCYHDHIIAESET